MSVADNKKLVQLYIDYLMQQEFDKLADLLSEDFQWVVPSRSETLKMLAEPRNKTVTIERMKALRGSMRGGTKLTPFGWTAEGDRVAVECEGKVVWNNGLVYNNLYHLVFVIRDGKIVKFTEYCDFLYAWETNPLLPKPKAQA